MDSATDTADRPEVTVIIPSKDRWQLLSLTLAGVLAQEDVDLEVVIVDDGSSDGTSDRLAALEDPRVRTLRNDPSQGVARARNRGIQEARGRWLAFLDDDDLWAPRKLRDQLNAAEANDATIVYSSALIVSDAYLPLEVNPAPPAASVRREILRRMAIPGGCSNLIAKADLVREAGGFDVELHAAADWDMWTRLILAGLPADCPEIHVAYVIHSLNMSMVDSDRYVREFEHIERKFRAERAAAGVEVDGVTFTRWLAGGYRRGGRRSKAFRTYVDGAIRYRSLGNLMRAAGMLLGESAMSRGRGDGGSPEAVDPPWLADYRPGGAFEPLAPVPPPTA